MDVVSWAIRPWLSQGAVGVVYQCKVKCRGRMFGCWLGAVDVVCGCKADAKAKRLLYWDWDRVVEKLRWCRCKDVDCRWYFGGVS